MNKAYGFLFSLMGLFSHTVSAEEVRIAVNGSILEQSCNVKSSDLSKNVIFDDISIGELTPVGATTSAVKVLIALENCTGNVDNMAYMFSGIADDSNPELLKVTGKTGANTDTLASGLAIEILDLNKKPLPLNQKQTFPTKITSNNFDFIFYLRYKSTSQNVKAGDASSLLYLDFYYE